MTFSSCIDEMIDSSALTLSERIGDNTVDLHNYLKYAGGKGRKTGRALVSNKVQFLSVVDIDINKEYNEEQREKVRADVIDRLAHNDVIVKTGSGGLHVYCNTELFPATSNRMVKCYTCDDFDIDIFSSVEPNKQSLVVLPETKVRKNATQPITTYEFVQG